VDKRKRNILIWVLAWAGLLVLVLYSPVGSPDLYVPTNYNTTNQGIAITSAELSNRPAISSSASETSNPGPTNLLPTDYSRKTVGSYSSSVNSSTQFSSFSGGSGGSFGFTKGRSGGGMEGSSMASYSYSSARKSESSASPETGGIMSVSSDFTSPTLGDNGTTVRQSVTDGTLGGTDPGGDPTGDPIPVGDGWIFLLVLASAYTAWKKIRI
jgi:hypothetical protein